MSGGAARRRASRLRAAWRLARCMIHGGHALGVVVFAFPRLDPAERQARIQWWSRTLLRRLDVRVLHSGWLDSGGGCLLVANHVSWLDILAIQAVCPQARFVSKAEVRSWRLLARLIDAGGTLYLERERKRDALRVVGQVAAALGAGDTVAVFPEGTTGDGQALLRFHPNLFQAAIGLGAPVLPVAIRYSDDLHAVSPAVDFVGDTTLVQSMWRVASASGLTVRLQALAPEASSGAERRELAHRVRERIVAALGIPRDTGARPVGREAD